MNVHAYINSNRTCPICSDELTHCFSHKNKHIEMCDGYSQVEFDLAKTFNKNTLYNYSYKILFNNDGNQFQIELRKDNELCDYMPLSVIKTASIILPFDSRKNKWSSIIKFCKKNCCAVFSDNIKLDLKLAEVKPFDMASFSLDLNEDKCKQYGLPYTSCKVMSFIDRPSTYIVVKNGAQENIIEYNYHITYNKIDSFLKKLPSYLLLS